MLTTFEARLMHPNGVAYWYKKMTTVRPLQGEQIQDDAYEGMRFSVMGVWMRLVDTPHMVVELQLFRDYPGDMRMEQMGWNWKEYE